MENMRVVGCEQPKVRNGAGIYTAGFQGRRREAMRYTAGHTRQNTLYIKVADSCSKRQYFKIGLCRTQTHLT